MKHLFSFGLIIMSLVLICSCNSATVNSNDTNIGTSGEPYSETIDIIVGSWETHFNEHTMIKVFEADGTGRNIADTGVVLNFTYTILNDHQIEQKMTTVDGGYDCSIYDFKLDGDTLIFDGMEFIRK